MGWEGKKEWPSLGNFWHRLQLWNVPRRCLPPFFSLKDWRLAEALASSDTVVQFHLSC